VSATPSALASTASASASPPRLILLAGIILSLPLVPGPGLPLIAVGLAMLALEFAWAERLLRRIAHRIDQVEERIGFAGIVALLAVAVAVGVAVVYWKM